MLFLLSLIGCNSCVCPTPPDYEKPMPEQDKINDDRWGDYPVQDSYKIGKVEKIYNYLDTFIRQV